MCYETTQKEQQRGATLTGYALTIALVVVLALGSIEFLNRSSSEVLVETGGEIGDMRPTLDELRNNPNAPPAVTPQNPPPGPPADVANPPVPQTPPTGYSFQNVNYQAGYASPILDLIPNTTTNPYQDDNLAFVFDEGGGPTPAGFSAPNSTGVTPGAGVCSLYLRFSPQSNNSSVSPVSVDTPGEILGYAMTDNELDNTDSWLGGTDPAGSIHFRNSRGLEGSEQSSVTTSGNNLSIPQLYAVANNTDEIRIFYNC